MPACFNFRRELGWVLSLAALLVLNRVEAENSLANLITNSPFGATTANGAGPENSPVLEFRGYAYFGNEVSVSIVQHGSDGNLHGEWMSLNQPSDGCVIRAFDPAAETVQAEFGGKTLVLGLKHSEVQISTPVVVAPPVENITPENQRRLAEIANEIGRRRAQRLAAQVVLSHPEVTPTPSSNR